MSHRIQTPSAAEVGTVENNLSFEENLARLEVITRQLERGELGLEESLAYYQEGVGLIRICQKSLERVSEQIEILTADAEVRDAHV